MGLERLHVCMWPVIPSAIAMVSLHGNILFRNLVRSDVRSAQKHRYTDGLFVLFLFLLADRFVIVDVASMSKRNNQLR